MQADFDHFLSIEDSSAPLMGVAKVSGSIGTATGKRVFLPELFFESRAKHPFVELDKRVSPIDVHYAKMEQDDVTYHVPAEFKVESAPPPTNTGWPNHAVLKITASPGDKSVEVVRTLIYNFVLLDAKDYPNLHDFYQKVASADQQPLVFTRAPVAKGD